MKAIKRFFRNIFILCILFAGIYVYAFHYEPNMLNVTEVNVIANENYENEIKIVLFSDTHYRNVHDKDDFDKIVDEINAQDADIVIFAGDLIDDYTNDKIDEEELILSFKNIEANVGKYAVMGNHDYGGYGEQVYKEIMAEIGFNLLINDVSVLETLGLNIIGVDDSLLGNPTLDYVKTLELSGQNIIVSHEGDPVPGYDFPYSLALSGHSHGGQINIPFLTELVLPIGSEEFVKGYYEEEKIVVSSGIGTTKIHARFLVPPEIVVIDFKY